MNSHNKVDEAESIALRFLIHYVADIHQPLHTIELVNGDYPKGDKGGNGVRLKPRGGAISLHSAWDRVMYEYKGFPQMPFSDKNWTELVSMSKKMQSNHIIPY